MSMMGDLTSSNIRNTTLKIKTEITEETKNNEVSIGKKYALKRYEQFAWNTCNFTNFATMNKLINPSKKKILEIAQLL